MVGLKYIIIASAVSPQYEGFSFLLLRSITFLIIFFIIIGAAVYTTKFMATKGMPFINQKNIKIIERVPLGLDKSLYLIKLDGFFYLISSGKNNIQLLDKINEQHIKLETLEQNLVEKNQKFGVYLKKYLMKKDALEKSPPESTELNNMDLMSQLEKIQRMKDALGPKKDRGEDK